MTDAFDAVFALRGPSPFAPNPGAPEIGTYGFIEDNVITASKLAVGLPSEGGNLLKNGSFEYADSAVLAGWVAIPSGQDTVLQGWRTIATTDCFFTTSASSKTGSRIGQFRADSAEANYRLYQTIPVVAGRTYRLTGWHWKGAGGGLAGRLRANTLDETQATVTFNVITSDNATTTPKFCDGIYAVPTDGSVSYLRIELLANGTPAGSDETFVWEDIAFAEVPNRAINTTGSVVIDETGITITNGALVLEDAYGESVLTPYGFGGTWLDFILSNVMNGTFGAGSTSDIAVSEVGDGDTEAEYIASVSPNLPNWVVAQSGGTLACETDGTAISGQNLKSSGASAQENRWYQDIPVSAYSMPTVWFQYRLDTPGASTLDIDLIVSWRDKDHALIGTEELLAIFAASAADHGAAWQNHGQILESVLGDSADEVRFLRVEFMVTHNTATTSTARFNAIRVHPGEAGMGRTNIYGLLNVFNDVLISTNLQIDTGSLLLNDPTSSISFIGSTYTAAITSETTGANLVLDARNIHFNGRMRLNNVISPSALTADTDNWAPTGYETANWIRAQSDGTPRTLTGIVAPAATGSMLWLSNINTAAVSITLAHDATSTSANRFLCPGYANYVVQRGQTVLLVYDNSVARWRVMGGL